VTMAKTHLTEQELRWQRIEKTRKTDKATGQPEIGSHGRAFLRWHNGLVDRVLVMHKLEDWKISVMRLNGGQVLTVPIDSLRTLDELLEGLKAHFPEHLPATGKGREELNPAVLPIGVINKLWGVAA
jgi:hypothetical protein